MPQLFFGPDDSLLSTPKDVIPFLGKREDHWNRERSAYQAAHSWFMAKGLPPAILAILSADAAFANATLERAVFEKKTRLDSFGRESQTDVLAFVTAACGPAVLGIEAKVDESFGPLVREWNDYSPGKLRRLAGLLDRLQIRGPSIGALRYQLFHRTAAAIIEAKQAGASQAAMIVQSFDANRAGFSDFVAFADAFGTPVAEAGRLSPPRVLDQVTIRLGWTDNSKQYSESA
jgi:hypothetical protein